MARYALIIGIAEYTGSFNSLETPVQNANAIAKLLDQYGDFQQVRRLPFRRDAGQKDPGTVIRKPLPSATLIEELQKFLQDANNSEVLIYYSGHGFTKFDPLSHESEGYLAPSDCQVELNAAGQIIAEKNGISLIGLNNLIKKHSFNSLVVILDCCNSGAFLESGMIRRDVTEFGYQRDYYLITACRSSSKAYEGKENSLLTRAVLEGLSAMYADPRTGRISGDRLFDVVGNKLQNSRQEPLRMGWGRIITLVTYRQLSESSEAIAQTFNATNPYMGLKAFEREQAKYFFGREQVVRALLDRLTENRFLAVIGPSGSGKSSLIRAGLLPELENDRIPGSQDWHIRIITPGQYPLDALRNALESSPADQKPVVLFVDQFEELFTLCPHEEEQRSFIKRLNEETNDPNQQTRVIVAMRGDFLDRCAKFQESADLINSTAPTTYMVIPLTEAKLVGELEDSITCPAALNGVSFEPGLVSRIVDDVVNQLGAMPLLQYALAQLWDSCISPDGFSRTLTLQSYEAIEGVKGALQRWADQFYTNLSPDDQTFVQEMIGELVQIGDNGEVTRRRASWERLHEIASSQEQLDRIIGRLVYQRLLVTDDKTVEVAHEALLSESKLIQGWIEENKESIRWQQRLEVYRRVWQERDCSEDYLLDAGPLAAIENLIEKKQLRLMSIDQEFIQKSREKRERQIQSQLEQERKLREEAEGRAKAEEEARKKADEARIAESENLKIANKALDAEQKRVKAERQRTRFALAAALGIGIISVFGAIQWRSADKGQIEALAVSSNATFNLNPHTFDALIDAIKAGEQLQKSIWFNQDPELRRQVLNSLAATNFWVREADRLEGHEGYVHAVEFSRDGQFIATAGFDNVAKFWTKEGKEIQTFGGHSDKVTDVSISPDNRFVATASYDKTVKVWNLKGEVLATLKGHTAPVWSVAFDADSELIASASGDGTIRLWKTNGQPIGVLKGHKGAVFTVVFSQDGTIISGSKDGTAKLWNFQGQNVQTLQGHTQKILGISLNPSQTLLATASEDQTVIVWNRQTGQPITHLKGINSAARDIAFSSDGQMIATGHDDDTLRLWNLQGKLLETLKGHRSKINSVSFSPDGNTLASGSNDKTVKLWNLRSWIASLGAYDDSVFQVSFNQSGNAIAASSSTTIKTWDNHGTLSGTWQDKSIYTVTVSPDGKTVASSSGGQIKLWTLQGQFLRVLGNHNTDVYSITFSPKGDSIISADDSGILKFWTSDGEPVASLQAHSDSIYRVVFSPDGNLFASTGADKTIKIWNRDRKLLHTLKGHTGSIYDISFSPDSKWLATVSEDNTLKIWSQDGTLLHDIKAHEAGVGGVSISKNGQIATVSDDRLIKLWTAKGEPIVSLIGHTEPVNNVAFSPDGTVLVTGSSDRRVLRWNVQNLTVKDLVSQGCERLRNYLQHNPSLSKELCRSNKQ